MFFIACNLNYDKIEFPVEDFKKILKRLKYRIIFVFMCFVKKMRWFFQFIFLIKNLKTLWIYYLKLMMINHIMCTSKILTHSCFIEQNLQIKNDFVEVVYNALVVKMFWQSIKKIV